MARAVNEEKYAERRKEILDVALKLVYTKGYEQMTIQDILDTLQISKGAFYHYFDSKGAVLETLVERMILDEAVPLLSPIVENPDLTALEKFQHYFDIASRWKAAQKPFMLELLHVWLADENAIVRQKLMALSVKSVAPLLTHIVHQGVREGIFSTPYPDQVSNVIFYVMQGLSEKLFELLVSVKMDHTDNDIDQEIQAFLGALTYSLERILGAQKGSLKLIDPQTLKIWFE